LHCKVTHKLMKNGLRESFTCLLRPSPSVRDLYTAANLVLIGLASNIGGIISLKFGVFKLELVVGCN
jgi:hypothetical protein